MARDFQWLVWGFKVRTEHRNAMELADCGSVLLKSPGVAVCGDLECRSRPKIA